MKKLVFLFAMVFAVSFVFGQNTATVNQGGTAAEDNTATILQTNGSNNLIFLEQLIENAGGTTDPDNTADITQDGNINIAKLKQTAGATGASTVGANWEPYNEADVTQTGNRNKLVGATSNAEVNENSNATQYSKESYNNLLVNQEGKRNMIGLNQSSGQWNDVTAGIQQLGDDNVLAVYQMSTYGGSGFAQYVEAMQSGNGNLARVKQLDGHYSQATVKQYGGLNKLVGADFSGVINENNPATQLAQYNRGVSELDVRSYAGNNTVGLFQEGFNSNWHSYTNGYRTNYAKITQNYGSNELGAYQKTTIGWNSLRVTQNGKDVASVCQDGTGNNDALIEMGGKGDLALLQTSGGDNSADIVMGLSADADLEQTGGADNHIDIEMGNGATLTSTQTALSGGSNWLEGIQSAGSTADVNQSGLNNWASITQ